MVNHNTRRKSWDDTMKHLESEKKDWRSIVQTRTRQLEIRNLDDSFERIADLLMNGQTVDDEQGDKFITSCEERLLDVRTREQLLKQDMTKIENEIYGLNQLLIENREIIDQELRQVAIQRLRNLAEWKQGTIDTIHRGSTLYKISSVGKLKRRHFFLFKDKRGTYLASCLLSNDGIPNHERITKMINTNKIKHLVLGQCTDRFLVYAKKTQDDDEHLSFSLVLQRKKSLDIIACDRDCFENWIMGLRLVLNMEPSYASVMTIPQEVTLVKNERVLCEKYHIPVHVYLNVKRIILDIDGYITECDIFDLGLLNFYQSEQVFQYFAKVRWIRFIEDADETLSMFSITSEDALLSDSLGSENK